MHLNKTYFNNKRAAPKKRLGVVVVALYATLEPAC
jgi:hypothetical protein